MATPVPTLVGSITETASDGTILIPNTTPPAVGDFLVAFVSAYQSGGSRTLNTPAGWTLRANQDSAAHICAVYTKTAVAGDVSASDFTFTISGAADVYAGAIFKITNHAVGTEVAGSEVDTGTTSFTFTTAITPGTADSLALALYTDSQNITGARSVSSYASTPSFTWTERVDAGGNNGAPSMSFAIATAPISGTSQITERTATASGATATTRGIIIVINGLIDASATPSAVAMTAAVPTPAVSAGATTTVSALALTAAAPTPVTTEVAPKWTNTDKNSSTWTNPDKS